jgi:hypothetical protein
MIDPAIVSIVQIIATAIVGVIVAKMGVDTKRAADAAAVKAEEVSHVAASAAAHVAEVKYTLAESTASQEKKLDGIAVVTVATYKLVNGALSDVLKDYQTLARRLAEKTGTQADRLAADAADKRYDDHVAGQKGD